MVYTLFEIMREKKNYEYLNNVTPPVKHAPWLGVWQYTAHLCRKLKRLNTAWQNFSFKIFEISCIA